MPRQFSFRGDRLAFSWGIVLLAAVAAALLVAFGGDTHALIPLYSVGVFVCFTLSQVGHGPALVRRARLGLGVAGGHQCLRRRAHLRRPDRRREREVRRRRVPRRDPHPDPRRDDAVHPAPVHEERPGARRPTRLRGRSTDPGRARDHARPGHQSRRRPGRQCRPLDRRRRPGGLHLRRPGAGARRSGLRGSARCRTSPSSSSSRPTGPWSGRSSPISTSWITPGRPDRPAPITFVVVPEYVAKQLVGADPLQPVGHAASARSCWAGRTPSWSTSRTGARTRRHSRPADPAGQKVARQARGPRARERRRRPWERGRGRPGRRLERSERGGLGRSPEGWQARTPRTAGPVVS